MDLRFADVHTISNFFASTKGLLLSRGIDGLTQSLQPLHDGKLELACFIHLLELDCFLGPLLAWGVDDLATLEALDDGYMHLAGLQVDHAAKLQRSLTSYRGRALAFCARLGATPPGLLPLQTSGPRGCNCGRTLCSRVARGPSHGCNRLDPQHWERFCHDGMGHPDQFKKRNGSRPK